jgi:hypothetical protein
MSTRISAVLGFLALAVAGVDQLGACGDKFLVGTLGGRYLSYAGKIHPTRILVYWQEDLDNPRGEGDSILESSLTEAGHSVFIAKDSESLYQRAASGGFEVIMMNVGKPGRSGIDCETSHPIRRSFRSWIFRPAASSPTPRRSSGTRSRRPRPCPISFPRSRKPGHRADDPETD